MKSLLLLICLLFAVAVRAEARIHAELVEYTHGDAVFEGYLAYDDSIKEKRPGVLVVHEWWGINPYIKRRVEQLAGLGYVAFAADIYGKGLRAKTAEEAGNLAGTFRSNRPLLRSRARAGLDILEKHAFTDPKRIAAIGYCFGGMTVLELARSGVDIAGVVSFHGTLATPTPADAKNVKAKVLALHGGDDPYVTDKDVVAFEDEMRKGGVDWQIVIYGGAVHSFTNPDSGNNRSRGAAYDEKANKRSWEAMTLFFKEIFK